MYRVPMKMVTGTDHCASSVSGNVGFSKFLKEERRDKLKTGGFLNKGVALGKFK